MSSEEEDLNVDEVEGEETEITDLSNRCVRGCDERIE